MRYTWIFLLILSAGCFSVYNHMDERVWVSEIYRVPGDPNLFRLKIGYGLLVDEEQLSQQITYECDKIRKQYEYATYRLEEVNDVYTRSSWHSYRPNAHGPFFYYFRFFHDSEAYYKRSDKKSEKAIKRDMIKQARRADLFARMVVSAIFLYISILIFP